MSDTIEALRHISCMARHLLYNDPEVVMLAVLLDMGVPGDRVGLDPLINSIVMRHEEPAAMLTKVIYPEVGKISRPRTNGRAVESAITHLLDDAWEHRDEEKWGFYFPVLKDGTIKRPTNGEFISQMACFLDLWQACKEDSFDDEYSGTAVNR